MIRTLTYVVPGAYEICIPVDYDSSATECLVVNCHQPRTTKTWLCEDCCCEFPSHCWECGSSIVQIIETKYMDPNPILKVWCEECNYSDVLEQRDMARTG